MFPPGFNFEHLAVLRNLEGHIIFANSDWASGWRGFIDGAIDRGGLAAKKVLDDARPSKIVPKI